MALPSSHEDYKEACKGALEKIMDSLPLLSDYFIDFKCITNIRQCRGNKFDEFYISEGFRYKLDSKDSNTFKKYYEILNEVEMIIFFKKKS